MTSWLFKYRPVDLTLWSCMMLISMHSNSIRTCTSLSISIDEIISSCIELHAIYANDILKDIHMELFM